MATRNYKMWTKDDIKKIARLWESGTTQQIAKELGRTSPQITSIATRMRKMGFKLTSKRINGHLDTLLREVLKETK